MSYFRVLGIEHHPSKALCWPWITPPCCHRPQRSSFCQQSCNWNSRESLWKIMLRIIRHRQKKEVAFLITVSLRDTMTFTSCSTELLVAYFIPKENMQPKSHWNYTYFILDLLPGLPSFCAITGPWFLPM